MRWRTNILVFIFIICISFSRQDRKAWIRINLLGYPVQSSKVAVYAANHPASINHFYLVNVVTREIVFEGKAGKAFGAYGPFDQTYRLDFSSFVRPGEYKIITDGAESPHFRIGGDVYNGTADFCLKYLRQQRNGFNPFLKDSCHTRDGYSLYGRTAGLPDSSYVPVSGGWHDASDYLQYVTTSANATYHLLMAARDFPAVFGDEKLANGLEGSNGMPDVLDEAKWGLEWLLKMHPKENWMFNQVADDRDHMGMRIPRLDSFYGRGHERPVYFLTGEPQQRGKFMNKTTGTSSTAGKCASAFALGSQMFKDDFFSGLLRKRARSAFEYANKKPGFTQTASVAAPYIYAEENWVDDMELACAALSSLDDRGEMLKKAYGYALQEHHTPWLGKDTASHYQWYPFINVGHYELARSAKGKMRSDVTRFYREGIEKVWNRASANGFYRGVPFIWCSNNLTISFAIQCYWYRQLTRDETFRQLEEACFDWIFGCNPWGTSMVYGLPATGDTPVDPHSAFTHLKNYPIDGGVVDGPVYGSIYKSLIGIKLYQPDEYALFQSELAVYHDDYGDYSTNEPTMDGTASLIYLLAAKQTGK
jgi:endoglucanase